MAIVAPPIFLPRMRISGTIQWICPYSGHLTRTRLSPTQYRMICSGSLDGCARRFIPGTVLYSIGVGKAGARTLPADWVLPVTSMETNIGLRESFPVGDLASVTWRRQEPTHVLVDPAASDFNVELFARTVAKLAEMGQGDDFTPKRGSADLERLARLGAAFTTISRAAGLNVNI